MNGDHDQPCKGCGEPMTWCTCPWIAPARPDWRESYPPLHCMICGHPMFVLPSLKAMAPQMTCGDVCKDELERRYYSGSVLQRPYEKPTGHVADVEGRCVCCHEKAVPVRERMGGERWKWNDARCAARTGVTDHA